MAGSVGVPNAATVTGRRFVLVDIKSAWADDWQPRLEFEAVRWAVATGALGGGDCELRYRYGNIKDAFETAYGTRSRLTMGRNWVRLRMSGDRGLTTVWQGACYAEPAEIYGATDGVSRGQQTLLAYDAVAILDRIEVYQSYWDNGGITGPLDWMPDINLRGHNGLLEGNRSSAEVDGTYVYGGTDEWTATQYINYVLERFVNVSGAPTFTLGGQTDILDTPLSPVLLNPVETVRSIIGKLIPPEVGVDYVPLPTDDGWELRVFSLVGESSGFESGLLTPNPNEFDIAAATDSTIMPNGLQININSRNLYDKLRVVGERVVSCCSLRGVGYAGADLTEGWTAAQETAYEDGTGTPADSADAHDRARAADKHRPAFQCHVASSTWDLDGGAAAPDLDLAGNVEGQDAQRQDAVRETLKVLPLREGWDYSQNPPINNNPAGVESGFRTPFAICTRYSATEEAWVDFMLDKPQAVADTDGIDLKPATIHALENEWGLLIEMSPNHALAANHWLGATGASNYDPDTDGVDYDNLALTIAIRTDQRLVLGLDVPDSLAAGDGSQKVIEVPGAEYWYLAPYTIVDIDPGGIVVESPTSGVVLRNDSAKLADAVAGAFARYLNTRAQADITYNRLTKSPGLVGQILANVTAAATDAIYVGAVVTSIQWDGDGNGGTGITLVKTGYA